MRISLRIELKDKPGQLIRAIEPISKYGGNIVSIVHVREETRGERVPVHLIFTIEDRKSLEKILDELERRDVLISKIGEEKKKEVISMVLIGHIVDSDLKDTVDRINSTGAKVVDLDLIMPHPEKESSARLGVEVYGEEQKEMVLKVVDEVAREKDFLVIRALEVLR